MTTPLGRELKRLIQADGPITIARYMALALGHPRYGYYTTRDPLGPGGDFVTAPEISQMFGELVGLWAAHAWSRAGGARRVTFAELGPGRGTLMRDALRAIARVAPEFRAAATVHLVETSPVLRERQAAALPAESVTWHDGIESLPDGPLVVVANEFFDALPIRQFVRHGGLWRERVVGLNHGGLTFGLTAEPLAPGGLPAAPDGSVIEIGEIAAAIMASLSRRIAREGGAGLIIDYGHLESAFGDTLQAVRRQQFVPPLDHPGEADLTAHVDFAALARTARAEGAAIEILTTQGSFLEAVGIRDRAAALKRHASPTEADDIDASLARLTDPAAAGMGNLFKVLAIGPEPCPPV